MQILKKLVELRVKPCIHWGKLSLKKAELIFMLLLGLCFFNLNAQSKIEAGSILFSHKHIMSENEEKQINQWQDTLSRIASQQKGIPYNPEDYAGFSIAQFLKNTPETIITNDFSPDTIWKYEMENGRIIGDFLRIERESGVVYYHAKIDKSMVYR